MEFKSITSFAFGKSFYRFSPELSPNIDQKLFFNMDDQMQILLTKVEQFVEESLRGANLP